MADGASTVISFGGESLDLAEVDRAVAELKDDLAADVANSHAKAIEEQAKADATKISETADLAFRNIEAAMHADVDSRIRGTPEAHASAAQARGKALESLQDLKMAVARAQERGASSFEKIKAVASSVPRSNLAHRVLRALASVRQDAVKNERSISAASIAGRIERLGVQTQLAAVAGKKSKMIADEEAREKADVLENLRQRETREMGVLREDSLKLAEYWDKEVCNKLVPLLRDARCGSGSEAVAQTVSVARARAREQNPDAEEVLRAVEASVMAAKDALEAGKQCHEEVARGGDDETIRAKESELEGLRSALRAVQVREVADTATLAAAAQEGAVLPSLERREEVSQQAEQSATALQKNISELEFEIATLRAERQRRAAGRMIEARQGLLSPRWGQAIAASLARIGEIRSDLVKKQSVFRGSRVNVHADVADRYAETRAREFAGYRQGCEELAMREEMEMRSQAVKSSVARDKFQQQEQTLGRELRRLLETADPRTVAQAERADAEMQKETGLAYQKALADSVAERMSQIVSLAGFSSLPPLEAAELDSDTFKAYNKLWEIMDYTFRVAPFMGFWKYQTPDQQRAALLERFDDKQLEAAKRSFQKISQMIRKSSPLLDSRQVEYVISQGARMAERAATGEGVTEDAWGGMKVGSVELGEWSYPSWFSLE